MNWTSGGSRSQSSLSRQCHSSPFSSSLVGSEEYRPLSPVASTWVQKRECNQYCPWVLHLQLGLPPDATAAGRGCSSGGEGFRQRGCQPGGNPEGCCKEAAGGTEAPGPRLIPPRIPRYHGLLIAPVPADAGLGCGEGGRRKMEETRLGPPACAGEERTQQQRAPSHAAERTPSHGPQPRPPQRLGLGRRGRRRHSRSMSSCNEVPAGVVKVVAATRGCHSGRRAHLVSTKSRRNPGVPGQIDVMTVFQTELERSKRKHWQWGERVKKRQAHMSGGGEGALTEIPTNPVLTQRQEVYLLPLLCSWVTLTTLGFSH